MDRFKDGYYHFANDLLDYPDAWCYVVWSRRGPGKTYSGLLYAYENHIPIIYMKRTDEDVDMITTKNEQALDFDPSPYAPLNEDKGFNIQPVKIKKGFGAFYDTDTEGNPYGNAIAYVLSFNQVKRLKGFNFRQIRWIIFDEFIPQQGEFSRRSEGEKLLDLYMTISRDRQKRGNDILKLVLFANAEEVSTPVTNELEIIDDMVELSVSNKPTFFDSDRNILLHHITLDEIPLTPTEKKGIYAGMYGTAWWKKSFEGGFTHNDFTNISKRTLKHSRGFIHLKHKTHDMYIYLNQNNGMYYMTSTPTRCMFDFDLGRENEQKKFWIDFGIDLRNSCIEERMKFEKYSMYDLIVNYKKFYAV